MQIAQEGKLYTLNTGVLTALAQATGLDESYYVDRLAKIATFFSQNANECFNFGDHPDTSYPGQVEWLVSNLHNGNDYGPQEVRGLANLLGKMGRHNHASDMDAEHVHRLKSDDARKARLDDPARGVKRFIESLKTLQAIVPTAHENTVGTFSTAYYLARNRDPDSFQAQLCEEWIDHPEQIIGFLEKTLEVLQHQPLVSDVEENIKARRR